MGRSNTTIISHEQNVDKGKIKAIVAAVERNYGGTDGPLGNLNFRAEVKEISILVGKGILHDNYAAILDHCRAKAFVKSIEERDERRRDMFLDAINPISMCAVARRAINKWSPSNRSHLENDGVEEGAMPSYVWERVIYPYGSNESFNPFKHPGAQCSYLQTMMENIIKDTANRRGYARTLKEERQATCIDTATDENDGCEQYYTKATPVEDSAFAIPQTDETEDRERSHNRKAIRPRRIPVCAETSLDKAKGHTMDMEEDDYLAPDEFQQAHLKHFVASNSLPLFETVIDTFYPKESDIRGRLMKMVTLMAEQKMDVSKAARLVAKDMGLPYMTVYSSYDRLMTKVKGLGRDKADALIAKLLAKYSQKDKD